MFWVYLATLITGIVLGLVKYARLLSVLESRHKKLYAEDLGGVRMVNWSAKKSINLQRFIYSRRPSATGDRELASLCRFLRWYGPVFVAILLIQVGIMMKWST